MNRTEKRILHGLYFHREMVGEAIVFTTGEVGWLAAHSRRAGKRWLKNERLQSTDDQNQADPRVKRFARFSAADNRPLRYLEQGGYIQREVMAHSVNALKFSVTVLGADYARQLGSVWGSMNLWYRERKDGLIGVFVTILVAALTATIASRLAAPRAIAASAAPISQVSSPPGAQSMGSNPTSAHEKSILPAAHLNSVATEATIST